MNRITITLFAFLCGMIITACAQSLPAGEVAVSDNCCNQQSCQPCKVTCKGAVKKETQSRHCWDVECDYVCIPPVKFPWTKCSDLPCPKIRKIHVMKRRDYKIDICKFHWKLKKIWPCCDNACAVE